MSEEDERAFRDAMSDVRPLTPRDALPEVPKPRAEARFRRLEEQQELQ